MSLLSRFSVACVGILDGFHLFGSINPNLTVNFHNNKVIKLLDECFARNVWKAVFQVQFQLSHQFNDKIFLSHWYVWVFGHLWVWIFSQNSLSLFFVGFEAAVVLFLLKGIYDD